MCPCSELPMSKQSNDSLNDTQSTKAPQKLVLQSEIPSWSQPFLHPFLALFFLHAYSAFTGRLITKPIQYLKHCFVSAKIVLYCVYQYCLVFTNIVLSCVYKHCFVSCAYQKHCLDYFVLFIYQNCLVLCLPTLSCLVHLPKMSCLVC